MKETILIPTDFTISSLNILKIVLERINQNQNSVKVEIILIFGRNQSQSITDLLFYSPYKIIKDRQNKLFEDGLAIITNHFESLIKNIDFEVFSGFTQNSFNNLIQARNIKTAFIPKTYHLILSKQEFNIIPYIKKSSLKIEEIDWNIDANRRNSDELNLLFNT